MGSSAKKKREKKQDFQKTKLKVGKARPKNTNATDTSFAAKSIQLKQQSLSESGREPTAVLDHNLSLLSSRNDTQRRDALLHLTSTVSNKGDELLRPVSTIMNKAQPLILDGSSSVRQQLLKLFKALPYEQIQSLEQTLLYTRAGMTHLSNDIRTTSLDILDWLLDTNSEAVVSSAGGWVKMLYTFQNLLSWQTPSSMGKATIDKWTTNKSTESKSGVNKLLVHQLTTLAKFLVAGLKRPLTTGPDDAYKAAAVFPLWQVDLHASFTKSDAFNHLNLFGSTREIESEVYDDSAERADIFHELNLAAAFAHGVNEAKSIGGEVGRAAAMVEKALRIASAG